MASLPIKNQKKYTTGNLPPAHLNEPSVLLLKTKKVKQKIILNGRRPANHLTPMEKLAMVKKGITKDELEVLKENAGLDYDTLAQGLSTARATLINIKGSDTFNFAVSEKIVGLEDIYSYGYEVFGDKETFNQWMFRPNKALGNQAPFDLVSSQFGREEVKNLVGRIDYGVFA
ncbi:MAG: antitoxin Xre/MbcA/ParS toxin-binding domain-containing protein [Chitinophagaceae bacterium]